MLAATVALMAGAAIPMLVQAEDNERSLTIYNIHTKETVTAVFKRNGRYVEAGVEKLNHVMRDYRRNEATKMDRELFDLLWQIHTELGSKAPIHLVSGFRSAETNAMLRRTVGGQAKQSRHILGKAADVHFPDIPLKQLRYSALIQERGGVGYYPTSALPFVHVDTDRVRSWPRLPRNELALLFPSGSTHHMPASGGPITREDVRVAKAHNGEMAQQIAMFLEHHHSGSAPVAVAEADARVRPASRSERMAALTSRIEPAPPSLVEQPRQMSRPIPTPVSLRASLSPSFGDRERLGELMKLAANLPKLLSGPAPARRPEAPHLQSLTGTSLPVPPTDLASRSSDRERQVASLGPTSVPPKTLTDAGRFDWGGGGWIAAPAYDDEHPEELSYRPFAVAPYLTESPEHDLMSQFVAQDVARTLEVLDQPDASTASFQQASRGTMLRSAQQFTGSAIKLNTIEQAGPPTALAFDRKAVMTSRR
ncbi:MAG: DUF882 domain-containing protein [Hyphomicrobiaceae bacterium]